MIVHAPRAARHQRTFSSQFPPLQEVVVGRFLVAGRHPDRNGDVRTEPQVEPHVPVENGVPGSGEALIGGAYHVGRHAGLGEGNAPEVHHT